MWKSTNQPRKVFVELFDLRVGDLYSSKRARHAVGLLYRSRPLKDVMVDIELYKLDGHVGNGVILKVLTVPKSRVVEILFDGNNGISTDQLRDEIGIEIGSGSGPEQAIATSY